MAKDRNTWDQADWTEFYGGYDPTAPQVRNMIRNNFDKYTVGLTIYNPVLVIGGAWGFGAQLLIDQGYTATNLDSASYVHSTTANADVAPVVSVPPQTFGTVITEGLITSLDDAAFHALCAQIDNDYPAQTVLHVVLPDRGDTDVFVDRSSGSIYAYLEQNHPTHFIVSLDDPEDIIR